MGTNECSQPASKSSWDSQDFGDVNMVLKMLHFHKSSRPQWVKYNFLNVLQIRQGLPLNWHQLITKQSSNDQGRCFFRQFLW